MQIFMSFYKGQLKQLISYVLLMLVCPNAYLKFYRYLAQKLITIYRVNSLLLTDFTSLASQDGDPLTDRLELQTFLTLVASNRGPPPDSVNGNDSNKHPGL